MLDQAQKYTVIIIDNETGGLYKLKGIMEEEQIRVILVFIQNIPYFLNRVKPDLLLLSGDIDKEVGLKVVNFIKKKHPELPVMIVASTYLHMPKGVITRLGIKDLLYRPFIRDIVATKIRRVLEQKEKSYEVALK